MIITKSTIFWKIKINGKYIENIQCKNYINYLNASTLKQ